MCHHTYAKFETEFYRTRSRTVNRYTAIIFVVVELFPPISYCAYVYKNVYYDQDMSLFKVMHYLIRAMNSVCSTVSSKYVSFCQRIDHNVSLEGTEVFVVKLTEEHR
jgi:hypothetical protein